MILFFQKQIIIFQFFKIQHLFLFSSFILEPDAFNLLFVFSILMFLEISELPIDFINLPSIFRLELFILIAQFLFCMEDFSVLILQILYLFILLIQKLFSILVDNHMIGYLAFQLINLLLVNF